MLPDNKGLKISKTGQNQQPMPSEPQQYQQQMNAPAPIFQQTGFQQSQPQQFQNVFAQSLEGGQRNQKSFILYPLILYSRLNFRCPPSIRCECDRNTLSFSSFLVFVRGSRLTTHQAYGVQWADIQFPPALRRPHHASPPWYHSIINSSADGENHHNTPDVRFYYGLTLCMSRHVFLIRGLMFCKCDSK